MNISQNKVGYVADFNKSIAPSNLMKDFTEVMRDFKNSWDLATRQVDDIKGVLPQQVKAMVEVQVSMNRLQLQSMTMVKAADAVSSSAKRVLQAG